MRGNAKKNPWTIGTLSPYNTETTIYVEDIKKHVPERRQGGGVLRQQ